MKICIIGDTHFGARNSNQVIEHWQRRFYEEIFWPYIEQNGISQVIQTGDFYDNRKWINLQTMAFSKEAFVKPAQRLGCNVHVILGNHDLPYRNSLKNSSVEQILSSEDNFTIYKKPTKVDFHDYNITMMPWICKENYDECVEVLNNGGSTVLGHFEITGFVMHPGAIAKDGISTEHFKNWDSVLSGHFHTQSEKGNIHYVGTPYQMSWSDANTKHGFWILDTETNEKTFVENPFRFFNRFVWEDGCAADLTNLEKSYVKVAVKKKTDFESFEVFIDKISFGNPHELKIIEDFEEYNSENVKDLIELSTTEDLISEYIEDVGTENNKDAIRQLMLSIYEEALNVED